MALDVLVKRDNFFDLISQAYSLIEKRNILPILSKVLLTAKKNRLYIQATDQDNSLQSSVSAKVNSLGDLVIDAQSLYDILNALPSGDIHLTEDKNGKKAKLKQKASVFNLLNLPAKDFPTFPSFTMKNSFKIENAILKNIIEKTIYSASMDDTRYHLTGVFFEKKSSFLSQGKDEKPCLRFVATDGHRLGLVEYMFKKNIALDNGLILSKKGIQEIKKLLAYINPKEDVDIALGFPSTGEEEGGRENNASALDESADPTRVLFRLGSAVLSVNLVEGNYPNYKAFISINKKLSITLKTEEFKQTLKRVSLLSSNQFKAVDFEIEKNKLRMTAENPDLGSAVDEVPFSKKEGDGIKIRFNARYVLEALNSIDSDEVLLEFAGPEKSCLFYPVHKKKSTQACKNLSVVMPMKI